MRYLAVIYMETNCNLLALDNLVSVSHTPVIRIELERFALDALEKLVVDTPRDSNSDFSSCAFISLHLSCSSLIRF